MNEFNIGVAFFAGVASFLSPCILPIIPGFLAYLAGDVKASRQIVFINSVMFVLGFSVVFAVLGVLLNSVLAFVATDVQLWLSRIGGVVIIIFGLYLTKLLHLPFLEKQFRFTVGGSSGRPRYATSFLFGLAFAAGWTPCVGAFLGSVLVLAATQPGIAFYLLLAYALGLGVPFLIIGALTAQTRLLIAKLGKIAYYLDIVFGVLLIILGVLVFTQSLSLIANFSFVNYCLQKL